MDKKIVKYDAAADYILHRLRHQLINAMISQDMPITVTIEMNYKDDVIRIEVIKPSMVN